MAGTRRTAHPRKRTVKPSILRDNIRRVVEAAQPDNISLFGSAARGETGPNSDVDLLVVKGGKFNRWRVICGDDAPLGTRQPGDEKTAPSCGPDRRGRLTLGGLPHRKTLIGDSRIARSRRTSKLLSRHSLRPMSGRSITGKMVTLPLGSDLMARIAVR